MKMTFVDNAKDFDSIAESLSKLPIAIEQLMTQFKDNLREKPSKDSFSLLEHACHLRDLEREGYLTRISKMLSEEHPFLPNFDGDRIAVERDYNNQDPMSALNDFKSAREESIEKFKSLNAEQFKKTGDLEGRGSINLEDLVCLMLEHDKAHLEELEELKKEINTVGSSINH